MSNPITYNIFLTDPTQLAELQALYPNGITGYSPVEAGVVFAAPFQDIHTVFPPFAVPCTRVTHYSADSFDVNIASGNLGDPTPGVWWWGYPEPSPPGYPWHWVGYFLPAPEFTGSDLSPRYWLDGFELFRLGEAPLSTNAALWSRDASRTPDGCGFAMRGEATTVIQHSPTELGHAATREIWQRFYIRIKQLPTGGDEEINRISTNFGHGTAIYVTTAGQLALYDIFGGTPQFKANSSVTLELNRWYRVDHIVDIPASFPGTGTATLCVGARNVASYSETDGGGVGFPAVIGSVTIGNVSGTARGGAYDFDDWVAAEIPPVVTIPEEERELNPPIFGTDQGFDGPDWRSGSHIQLARPKAFGTGHSGWTGDFRLLLQNAIDNIPSPVPAGLTSTTALAPLTVATDVEDPMQYVQATQGVHSFTVILRGLRAGVANGQLGYSINGLAFVMATITQSTSTGVNGVLYSPSGRAAPEDITDLELRHTKGNSVDAATAMSLHAVVEYLGFFGIEDEVIAPDTAIYPPVPGYHNAPYPQSAWVQAGHGSPPTAPLMVSGGIYTGNGTGQDIAKDIPVGWWWVRPLTGANGGVTWISSLLAAMQGIQQNFQSEGMLQALQQANQDGGFMRLGGNNAQFNQSGVDYQYIAICDPGMRCLLNGAYRPVSGATWNVPFIDSTFTPDAAMVFRNTPNGGAGAQSYYKGPGHAANAASRMDTTETADALTLGTPGFMVARAAGVLANSGAQYGYSLFRNDDLTGTDGVVFQILSYTGNGVNPRTISLTPVSGRWPLFALVVPHNAESVFRDPSHTGSNSSFVDSRGATDTTTGITGGGVDQITVNSLLNANGILYDVFVIPGSPDGWLNGDFYPRDIAPAPGAQWPSEPAPPVSGSACLIDFPAG